MEKETLSQAWTLHGHKNTCAQMACIGENVDFKPLFLVIHFNA